jgi:hypothetical protein
MGFALTIRIRSAFFTIDGLGLHAGLFGREIAWTRGSGWVKG